jgi:hypothetical protein
MVVSSAIARPSSSQVSAADLQAIKQKAEQSSANGAGSGSTPDIFSRGSSGSGNQVGFAQNTGSGNFSGPITPDFSLKGLNPQQRQVATKIVNKLNELGLTNKAFQAGVLANIKHESDFKEDAVGDSGHSIGVAQLHTRDGAGKGFSKEFLKDAGNNIAALYKAEKSAMDQIHSDAMRHNNAEQVAKDFCIKVERPTDKETKAIARAKTVQEIIV